MGVIVGLHLFKTKDIYWGIGMNQIIEVKANGPHGPMGAMANLALTTRCWPPPAHPPP